MGLLDAIRAAFGGSVEKTASNFVPWLTTTESGTGLRINQSTAVSISTVYACASIRSKDVARCTPRLMRDSAARSETPVTNHPVAKLFKRPNNWQTWTEFCRQMHCAFLLRGNAFAVILRDGRGNPVQLIPVNPDLVILYEAEGGEIFYNVTRSSVFMNAVLKGVPLLVPEDDIFHLRELGFHLLMGLSRVSIARDSFGVALGLEQQAARFMNNGARPAGVLQTDKVLSADTAERLRTQWSQLREGIQNVGKTAVLEEGLKWTPMQLSSVDLEFISQREFSIGDIARWFDVPLYKLGVKGEMGRLKPDDVDQQYVNQTIMPDLDAWEQKFVQKFDLDKEGLVADFDERRLLRAAEATRINNQRLKIMSGISTQNECRAENGDPPMDGGDVLLTPVNLAPQGSDMSGTAPEGAGRPDEGTLPASAGGAKTSDDGLPALVGLITEHVREIRSDRDHLRGQITFQAETIRRQIDKPHPAPSPVNLTVERQDIHVGAPEIQIDPQIHVAAAEIKLPEQAAPVVNITQEAPVVNLSMPPQLAEKVTVTKHSADGRIAEYIKTPITEET